MRHGYLIRLIKEMQHLTHEDYVPAEKIKLALENLGNSFSIDDAARLLTAHGLYAPEN